MSSVYPGEYDDFTSKIPFSCEPLNIEESIEVEQSITLESGTPSVLYSFNLSHEPIIGSIVISGYEETFLLPVEENEFYAEIEGCGTPYLSGRIHFHETSNGLTLDVSYDTYGDRVKADHINKIQSAIESIEKEMGLNPSKTYSNVSTFLNWLENKFDSTEGHTHNGIDSPRISFSNISSGSIQDRHISSLSKITMTKIGPDFINDSFSGEPQNLKNNLDQIGSQIKKIIGGESWDSNPNTSINDSFNSNGSLILAEINGTPDIPTKPTIRYDTSINAVVIFEDGAWRTLD